MPPIPLWVWMVGTTVFQSIFTAAMVKGKSRLDPNVDTHLGITKVDYERDGRKETAIFSDRRAAERFNYDMNLR